MINCDDNYVDDRLKNTTRINPIDQFILKYRDCKIWEKTFLTATEGSLCRERMRLLNDLSMFVCENVKYVHEDDNTYEEFNPSSFLYFYTLAKAAVENAKKIDISQELQDLKSSPDRMADLRKAIAERVYPPKTDPLMLNPLYRSVTDEDFIGELDDYAHTNSKIYIHYRSEGGAPSSVEEIVERIKGSENG